MMLTPRFEQAFQYATIIHAGQMRKGTEVPYLAHLMAVTSLVLEHGADEEEAMAALLHDAVEDAGGRKRYHDIQTRFGERVASIVSECTQKDKREYVHQIPTLSASARLVSVADKLHNSRSILRDFRAQGDSVWDRFNGTKEGKLWYYRALTDAFLHINDVRCNPMIAELNLVVTAIEELNKQNGHR
jgi:(p)ppGpp synthase/HD superfamily hydrolase